MGFNLEKKSISSLDGDIFYVDDDFNESTPGWNVTHFAKIRDALNFVIGGDTIFVYSGLYTEHFIVNKRINLIGEDRNTTIIYGDPIRDVISINAKKVNISRFTIQNGYCGIVVESKNITISGNNISANFEDGINIQGSKNTVMGNIICSNNGDGVSIYYCSNNNITANRITNNLIGIKVYRSEKNLITNNNISSNLEDGINLVRSYNKIIKNTLSMNKRYGIFFERGRNKIHKNNFLENGQDASFETKFVFRDRKRWKQNYWNEPRIFPKIIRGDIIISRMNDPSRSSWFEIDWHPAQEPYDIGG
jgi:parallel beta-helix repeat protein